MLCLNFFSTLSSILFCYVWLVTMPVWAPRIQVSLIMMFLCKLQDSLARLYNLATPMETLNSSFHETAVHSILFEACSCIVMDQIAKPFPVLWHALVRSKLLRTLLWNICYLSYLFFLSIRAPKFTHDLTSSGCSRCCALSHHSQICSHTIISLFYFILVANNKFYCSHIFYLVIRSPISY